MLNINKTIENGKAAFSLEGRLDTVTSPSLEAELKDALDGVSELTMDFKKLEYISSAGLRVLLAAQKEMNKRGSMKLTHVGETIMEIFEVTGFTDILTIE
ncbi:MAG: STAS domain-containing protein [Oscillospiraceae bacterium]|nr:STAS domain-containing protein [Oscillospiraceae bacterium]